MIASVLLIVSGVFNFAVWPPFYRRTARDPRARDSEGRATRFFRVHAILIGSALVLAVVFIVFGILGLAGVTN
jgi:hypothetical protein